jgi:hypothetical protein
MIQACYVVTMAMRHNHTNIISHRHGANVVIVANQRCRAYRSRAFLPVSGRTYRRSIAAAAMVRGRTLVNGRMSSASNIGYTAMR